MSLSKSTNYLKIGQAAKALGVSIDTLRRWEKAGKITAIRTPGGTRLYSLEELRKINPQASTVQTYQTESLTTEELLRETQDQTIEDGEPRMEDLSSTINPQNTTIHLPSSIVKSSFLTNFLIGTAFVSVVTLSITAWISASYLTAPKDTQRFFKNNIASPLLKPFHKLAESAVAVISPEQAKQLGFLHDKKPSPLQPTPHNLQPDILAVTASPQFLEVNSDTQINGSLYVRDSINGAILEATPSSSTITLASGGTTLTVSDSAEIDQDVSTTSTPTFSSLTLSSTTNQLSSGGFQFTLPGATTTLVGTDTTQTLTKKSLSGSANTFTNIPNSALTNSKITVTAGTNLTGGGDVNLGSSITIALKDSPAISGVISLANGTAAAPSLTFTSDADIGLYRVSSDTLGFVTGGLERFNISSSGHVLPTLNDIYNLGSSSFRWLKLWAEDGDFSDDVTIGDALTVTGSLTVQGTTLATTGNIETSGSLSVGSSVHIAGGLGVVGNTSIGTTALYVNVNTNRVGINTSAPASTLAVLGNAGIGVSFAGQPSPVNGLAIQGNVGIGTTSPATALHIIGNTTTRGHILADINNLYDIGSAAITYRTIYANEVNASTLVGTLTGGNLTADTFTINSDNLTDDAESSNLRFHRGTASPHALFTWDSTTDEFDLNSQLHLTGTITPTNGIMLDGVTNDIITPGNETLALIPGGTGNVGINTTSPYAKLQIKGAGTGTGISLLTTDSSGTQRLTILDNGNVGIGVTNPSASLTVHGNVGIGYTNVAIPSNGLAVSGNVGIGITTANSALTVNGGAAIGTGFNATAPANGLIVQGNTGVGFTSPDRLLQTASDINITSSTASLLGTAGSQFSITGSSATGLSKKLVFGLDTTDNYGVIQAGNTDGTNYTLSLNPAGGNVGIGTTSPIQLFQINSGNNNILSVRDNVSSNESFGGGVYINKALTIGDSATDLDNRRNTLLLRRTWTASQVNAAALRINDTITAGENLGIWFARFEPEGFIEASSGTHPLMATVYVHDTVITDNGATTTDAVSLYVDGPPTGITPTNPALSLWVNAGNSKFDGGVYMAIESGNVGIGATLPQAKLVVQGNVGIGFTGVNQSIPVNGLAVFGNVGIGITTANSNLVVNGNANIGSRWQGVTAPANGLLVEGNIGVANSAPNWLIHALGSAGEEGIVADTLSLVQRGGGGIRKYNNAVIQRVVFEANTTSGHGEVSVANVDGTTTVFLDSNSTSYFNGGNLGVGTTTANSTLSVAGSAHIGTIRQGIAAPTNGLFVDGNVGIGATTYSNLLDVWGNARITGTLGVDSTGTLGSGLIGFPSSATAPSSGLAVSGNVGVGTTSPLQTLHVVGQCVTGDTKLRRRRRRKGAGYRVQGTDDEYEEVRIDQIRAGDEILTLDEASGEFVPSQVRGLMDMGIQQTYLLITETGKQIRTTAEHPYLVREELPFRGFPVESNVGQKSYNHGQGKSNGYFGVDISKINHGFNPFLNLMAVNKQTIPSIALTVNNPNLASMVVLAKGTPQAIINQPADKLTSKSDNVIVTTESNLLTDITSTLSQDGKWIKISQIKAGMEVATVDGWEKIVSIKEHAREQVWDIEVENTHNFVGNDIVAHNTYITGNVGLGVTTPGSTLSINGNSVIGYSGVNIAGPSSGLAVSGNVGVGTTSPLQALHVVGQCVAKGTRIRRRRRRKGKSEEEIDLINLIDLISKENPSTNDQKEIQRLTKKLGIKTLEIGNLLDQLEQLEIRNFEEVPVEDIKPDDEVLSLNDVTGTWEWHKVEKTMDMGIQEVFRLETEGGKWIETTANHPYLVRSFQVSLVESNENQKESNHQQSKGYLSPYINIGNNITKFFVFHNVPKNLLSSIAATKEIIAATIFPVNIQRLAFSGFLPKAGKTNTAANQPADRFISHSAIDDRVNWSISPTLSDAKLPVNQGEKWIKVSQIKVGMEIATVNGWEKISNIYKVGRVQTYDLQIEGTHNFVGNNIVAHNTYISGNVGLGVTTPGSTLSINGNSVIGYSGVNIAGPSSGLAVSGNVGIGITTANSALTVNGGASIGASFNVTAPTNGLLVQGNTGIGFTTPAAQLHIGTNTTTAAGGIQFGSDISLYRSAPNILTTDDSLFINDNANTGMTLGVTINQGGNDDEILSFKSSDVTHGVTTVAETDTYGLFKKTTAGSGGVEFMGINGGTGVAGLTLTAIAGTMDTGKTSSENAAVYYSISKINGTGRTGMDADSNMVTFTDNGTNEFIFDADGDLWLAGDIESLGGSEIAVNESGASVDFRIEGDTNPTLFFVDASADSVGIGTTAPSQRFQVNNSINTPFVVTSGGNVGIGFTTPDRLLQIGSDITGFGNALGTILGAGGSQLALTGSTANTLGKKLTFALDSTNNLGVIQVGANLGIGTTAAYNLSLNPLGGNVGIGTTSPLGIFEVNPLAATSGNGAPVLLTAQQSSAAGTGGALTLKSGAGGSTSGASGGSLSLIGGNQSIALASQFTKTNSEYLSIADNASVSTGDIDFTWTAWVYKDTSPASELFFISKDGGTSGTAEYGVLWQNTENRFRGYIVNSTRTTFNIVDANSFGAPSNATWYFVAFWHDSVNNTVNIQINNGTVDSLATTIVPTDSTSALNIGARSITAGSDNHWDGRIAGVGFWKKALSATERTALYNSGSGLVHAGLSGSLRTNLTSYWNLSEASGSRADSAGTNTLTDNATVTGANGPAPTTAGTGGALTLTGGTPGITGTGGAISLTTGVGGTTSGSSGALTLDTGTVTSGSVGALHFNTGGNSRMTVTGAGFVGIGFTNPLTTLGISGNVNIGFTGQVSDALGMAIRGNVGIGTTSPRAPLEVVANPTGGSSQAAALFLNGNVGIGTTATGFNNLQVTGSIGIGTSYSRGNYELDVAGEVRAVGYFGYCNTTVDQPSCNQDVAEIYPSSEDVEPGDLLVITASTSKVGFVPKDALSFEVSKGVVEKSTSPYQSTIMGIVSTSPGLLLGINGSNVALGSEASDYPQNADPRLPAVALSGKVPLKVSTENGPIEAGDYLTSSSVRGVAMKALRPGPVVGKALESYDNPDSTVVGKIMAFVNVSYADPGNFFASLSFDNEGNLIVPKIKVGKLTLDPSVATAAAQLTIEDDQLALAEDPSYASAGPNLASNSNTYDLAGKIASLEERLAALENEIAQSQTPSNDIAGEATSSATPSADLAEATSAADPSTDTQVFDPEAQTRRDLASLDLTPPDLLLATPSATLADLNTYSEATVSGMLTAYDLKVSNTLKSLGTTTLGQTTIAGRLTIDGLLTIDNGSEINVIGGTLGQGILYLQKSALARGVDIFDGKVTIDKDGTLKTVTLVADQIKVNEGKTAGSGKILAGQTEVVIENPYVEENSIILVTPNIPLTQSLAVMERKAKTSTTEANFKVKMAIPQTEDITFDYLIIGQEKISQNNISPPL